MQDTFKDLLALFLRKIQWSIMSIFQEAEVREFYVFSSHDLPSK